MTFPPYSRSAVDSEDLSAAYDVGKWAFCTPLFDVYAAVDTRLQRAVHVRFLTPRAKRHAEVARAIVDAARRAASTVHPNLVNVYDIGSIGGRVCVVTEAPPERLSDRKVELSPDEAEALARDWAEGLRAGHLEGFVHGDVNPESLFIADDGSGKVADIGLFAAAARVHPTFRPRRVVPVRAPALTTDADVEALHVVVNGVADTEEPIAIPIEPLPDPSPVPLDEGAGFYDRVDRRALVPIVVVLALVLALFAYAMNDTDRVATSDPSPSVHVGA